MTELERQLLPLEPLPFLHTRLRQAAVLVLLFFSPAGECRVLLTRRSHQLRHHAGQVAFPGGALDGRKETPLKAALRETREEVGLRVPEQSVIGRLESRETLSGFQVHPFVAVWPQTPRCSLHAGEVSEVFHVALHELAAAGLRPVQGVWQGKVRSSVGFGPPWSAIWGVTAKILAELLERLEMMESGPLTR